ncbi:methylated-DNA--[protein]-cysteine S-methyltransferase [Microbacterium sp.]|uniref:methylated-DNA--[protein]-cysteine S-methyltransferase n=1 Tax=Microbacterium sp. TaxID=51671 RepID=UPI003A8CC9C0
MDSFGTVASPVGTIGVISDGVAVTTVGWNLRRPMDAAAAPDAVLTEAIDQLTAYFAGALRRFDVPLDLGEQTAGTRAVLEALYESVGYGEKVTYGELAARSGSGIPARGIGAIMGANPIPIIVPCHRVVAGDGLGGYSGGERGKGPETKRWLLEFEGALPAPLF